MQTCVYTIWWPINMSAWVCVRMCLCMFHFLHNEEILTLEVSLRIYTTFRITTFVMFSSWCYAMLPLVSFKTKALPLKSTFSLFKISSTVVFFFYCKQQLMLIQSQIVFNNVICVLVFITQKWQQLIKSYASAAAERERETMREERGRKKTLKPLLTSCRGRWDKRLRRIN